MAGRGDGCGATYGVFLEVADEHVGEKSTGLVRVSDVLESFRCILTYGRKKTICVRAVALRLRSRAGFKHTGLSNHNLVTSGMLHTR